jgi:hypothetical protein
MYTTCLHCHAPLGSNEVVEQFPVGRRLAFDAATGRLWVVCGACQRWNLTPIEERWEAIETCERLFRDTHLRVSTENIGLARLREGTELVRVGRPMRPEMAVWRYGDQFLRRRRESFIVKAVGVAGTGALLALGVGYASNGIGVVESIYDHLTAPRIRGATGTPIKIVRKRARDSFVFLDPERPGQIALRLAMGGAGTHFFSGDIAERRAAVVLPKLNASGAARHDIDKAIDTLERVSAKQPPSLVVGLASTYRSVLSETAPMKEAPPAIRLALEMALHEDVERAALEGELHALEERWKEAEEIAHISDNLFLPASVVDALNRLRGR